LGKAKKQKKDLKRKKKEEVRLLEYPDSALPDIAENKPKPTEAALQTLILYMNLVATGKICKNKRVVEEAAKSPSRKALVSTRGTPILQPRWALPTEKQNCKKRMLWWTACWCSRVESLNLKVDFKGSQRRKEREGCRMCASVNSSAGFLGGASKLRYWGVDQQATKRRRSGTCYATLKTVKPSFTGLQPNARLSDNSIFPRWRFRILFKSPVFVVAADAADVMRLGRTELEVSRLGIGTLQWGDPGSGFGDTFGETELATAFDVLVHGGINFFDTAEVSWSHWKMFIWNLSQEQEDNIISDLLLRSTCQKQQQWNPSVCLVSMHEFLRVFFFWVCLFQVPWLHKKLLIFAGLWLPEHQGRNIIRATAGQICEQQQK
jgi:hypothetical protein